ncbi:hypothetical protein JMM60_14125 [Rhodovulum sulfidophilum]|uniref:Quinohemoprotein amine dehydrogenase alpha subunit haem binding domain-containing protein n=2 Tax=Rhodovulum sulfidophilum TaxID=35806 RepID=A0ABS1RUY9_RHOSU|nr:hypothetical protein [Rhodovulum sulfidophilum]
MILWRYAMMAGAIWALAGGGAAAPLPKGEGLKVIRKECTRCHPLRNIVNSDGFTAPQWRDFIVRMTDLENRPENLDAVVAYLAEHFPPYAPDD